MVRIRLRRTGLKGQPSYRIVVADQRSARSGGFIEIIGTHNARTLPITDIVDEARVLYWLSVGAQPSEAVNLILRRTGTLDRFERMKGGEPVATLVAEAAAAAAARGYSAKTRHAAPAAGEGTMKPKGE